MFSPYCSTVTLPHRVFKKMWFGDENTQYLVSFPGHSQIVSHSRGDQSWSGLGVKPLGSFCTFEVIVK